MGFWFNVFYRVCNFVTGEFNNSRDHIFRAMIPNYQRYSWARRDDIQWHSPHSPVRKWSPRVTGVCHVTWCTRLTQHRCPTLAALWCALWSHTPYVISAYLWTVGEANNSSICHNIRLFLEILFTTKLTLPLIIRRELRLNIEKHTAQELENKPKISQHHT